MADKKAKRKAKVNERRQLIAMIRNLKAKTPCSDCNNFYPFYVMQFDHRPFTCKKDNISSLAHKGSTKEILKELAKCDIVCANCHARCTYARRRPIKAEKQLA